MVANLTYDVQGNLAAKGAQAYQFDLGNRLRSVPGKETGYEYDGHGRRVHAQTVGSSPILSQYGNAGQVLYQQDQKQAKRIDYIYLGGSLVASRERPLATETATLKYQHTDALGTPVAVTNAAKTTTETSEYEPYGQLVNKPAFDGPGFTGHVQDAATGLTYMQQRYYDPMLGVFLSVDPVTAYDNPISQFHRYRYANNNPYRFVDPDGRVSDEPQRQARDFRSMASRPGLGASNIQTMQVNPSSSSSSQQGSANIRYNASPPRTVPPSGENAKALQCTADCVGADEILVTGGAEQSGHSRNSLHYQDKAVDIVGPPFNNVEHREIMWCARACGYTHGGWEVNGRFYADGDARGSIYKDHWHFQVGGSGRVPSLPSISPSVPIGVTKSPTSSGGMIGR